MPLLIAKGLDLVEEFMVGESTAVEAREWRVEGCVFGARPRERRGWIGVRRSRGLNVE